MRKIAWFVVFLAVLTPTLWALCLTFPDTFGAALYNIFLVTLPNAVAGALTGLMVWGSASAWQAATVAICIFVGGYIALWAFRRLVWTKHPILTKPAPAQTYQHAPLPTLPQSNVQPVPAAAEPEKKEEEATA